MIRRARNALPIAIAGGGIGGLACALALAQKGFSVVVCEQASQFGEIGAGLHVAPNALSVLDAIGVGEEVKQRALLIERMLMMDGISGEPVVDIPCGDAFQRRFGNPYAVAHRADVHGPLLRACRALDGLIEMRTRSRLLGFKKTAEGVEVQLHNGRMIAAVALIAADGIHSKVRQQLFEDGEPERVAVIYRTLIPAARMPRELHRPHPTI